MRTLSQVEKQIISAAQLQAELSIAELAKQVKMRSHTVRYVVEKLKGEGILTPYPFVNYVPLGFLEHDLYCSLKFRKTEDRVKFLDYLKKSRIVSWLIELGGDYQYGIGFLAKNVYEVHSAINEIATRFGPIFIEKTFATCLRWSLFRRKYLSTAPARVNELRVGPVSNQVEIDEVDSSILAVISKFPDRTSKDLAEMIRLPPTTFSYRLNALRGRGIYLGLIYGLEPANFGMQVFRIQISLSEPGKAQIHRLYEIAKATPWVVSFVEFFGGWDIAMRIEVPQSSDAFTFSERIVDNFGSSLSAIRLFPVFYEQKFHSFPWLVDKDDSDRP